MDGLLIVDKPRGLSSHDAVARARRLLRERRIGHAGTLDPLASGVLVLCIGQATRLSEYLLGEDKAYEGVIKLGERTTTDDAEGEIIASRAVPPITDAALRALEAQFSGPIEQAPPQFSAIQRGGQRAYALARKGEWVALEPRRVTVYELQLAPLDEPTAMAVGFQPSGVIQASQAGDQKGMLTGHLVIRLRCSAGTYVRALARDIGEALGCGAHLVALRRTQAGRFTLAEAVGLDRLEAAAREGRAESWLLPMDRAVADWPAARLSDEEARRLKLGQAIIPARATGLAAPAQGEVKVRVYDSAHVFLAVACWDGTKLKPVKVFDAAPPLVR